MSRAVRPALEQTGDALASCGGTKQPLAVIKRVRDTGLKIPQLAMPVRVLMERRRHAFAGHLADEPKRCRHAIESSEKSSSCRGLFSRYNLKLRC
jgi:hypothetical protein